MYWDVIEIQPQEDLTLWVRFTDSTSGHIKFTLSFLTGVFEPLKNQSFFAKAYLEDGVVTWPGEIDLAPDAMYHEIKKNGQWILS